jgi:hypothetical protein
VNRAYGFAARATTHLIFAVHVSDALAGTAVMLATGAAPCSVQPVTKTS